MDRLPEQSVWNAILLNVRWDGETEHALRTWGVDEFFEDFGATFPYEEGPFSVPENSALKDEERHALQALVDVLNAACDCTSDMSGDDFLGSSWAPQIATLMRESEAVMTKRNGFFSSVYEEEEPSIPLSTGCPHSIFMPLLDEGVDVWRPVDGVRLADSTSRILGPMPNQERWAFEPGTIVNCEWKTFADGVGGMTAISAAP